jgi:hypothetical protein
VHSQWRVLSRLQRLAFQPLTADSLLPHAVRGQALPLSQAAGFTCWRAERTKGGQKGQLAPVSALSRVSLGKDGDGDGADEYLIARCQVMCRVLASHNIGCWSKVCGLGFTSWGTEFWVKGLELGV